MATTEKITLLVLHKEQLAKLARGFPPLMITNQTSDKEAGYIVGVHAVLNALRDGFTID